MKELEWKSESTSGTLSLPEFGSWMNLLFGRTQQCGVSVWMRRRPDLVRPLSNEIWTSFTLCSMSNRQTPSIMSHAQTDSSHESITHTSTWKSIETWMTGWEINPVCSHRLVWMCAAAIALFLAFPSYYFHLPSSCHTCILSILFSFFFLLPFRPPFTPIMGVTCFYQR